MRVLLLILLLGSPCLATVDTLKGSGEVEDAQIRTKDWYYTNLIDYKYSNFGAATSMELVTFAGNQGYPPVMNWDSSRVVIRMTPSFAHPELVSITEAKLIIKIIYDELDQYGGTINVYKLDSNWAEGSGDGTYFKSFMDSGVSWDCYVQPALPQPDSAPPPSWNWDSLGGMTPVKNQGDCGSCWAFGTIGAIEAAQKIYVTDNDSDIYSEQHLMDCVYSPLNGDRYACGGGEALVSLHTLLEKSRENGGIAYDSAYPYQAIEHTYCLDDSTPMQGGVLREELKWFWPVDPESTAIIKRAIMVSPIVVAIKNFTAIFSAKPLEHDAPYVNIDSAPCYDSIWGTGTKHEVVLMGWDSTEVCWISGQSLCWWFKNSWDTNFGLNGYGRAKVVDKDDYGGISDEWVPLMPSVTAQPKYWTSGGAFSEGNLVGTAEIPCLDIEEIPDTLTVEIDLDTTIVREMIAGTNTGFIIVGADTVNITIVSTEGVDSLRPYFILTYTEGEVPAETRIGKSMKFGKSMKIGK